MTPPPRLPVVPVVGILLLVASAAVACTHRPGPSPSPDRSSPTVSSPVASGAKPGPSALRYNASSFDLCARTDRRPLADLALTVEQTNDRPTLTPDPGAACLFEMRTPDGYMANLLVRAATPASIEEAEGLFRSTRRVTAMDFAGAVTGLGDEAEAYSKESEPGFKYSEYKVSVRSGNLVLDVWLAVGGVAFTPVATLAERSQAIARTVLTQIPRV